MSTAHLSLHSGATLRLSCATRFERLVLRAAAGLEALALRRMARRAGRTADASGAGSHRDALLLTYAETRRDAFALAHSGIIPR